MMSSDAVGIKSIFSCIVTDVLGSWGCLAFCHKTPLGGMVGPFCALGKRLVYLLLPKQLNFACFFGIILCAFTSSFHFLSILVNAVFYRYIYGHAGCQCGAG